MGDKGRGTVTGALSAFWKKETADSLASPKSMQPDIVNRNIQVVAEGCPVVL